MNFHTNWGFQYFNKIIYELNSTGENIKGTKGFHSYSSELKYKLTEDRRIEVYKSISSKETVIMQYFVSKNLRIAQCYIPIGSKYTINENGEVISSSIVIDKISDPFSKKG